MFKRGLLLLLIAGLSSTLQAITVYNKTKDSIELHGFIQDRREARYQKILAAGCKLEVPELHQIIIEVAGERYTAACSLGNYRNFCVVVSKTKDGFVQLAYKPIQ